MSDGLVVSAVILCGGLGTRLRPVLPNSPKTLATINSTPFLIYLLDQICQSAITEVILCTGHLSKEIVDKIGYSYKQLRIHYSHEEKPLGTGGALRNCLSRVSNELILVMNGDSYVDVSLNNFIEFHKDTGVGVSMITKEADNLSRFGRVVLDKSNRVIEFSEKEVRRTAEKGFINAGVYLIKKTIIEELPDFGQFSLEKEVFPGLIVVGLQGFITQWRFIDIGTPESYLQSQSIIHSFNKKN